MEDVVRKPVELIDDDLDAVAGGFIIFTHNFNDVGNHSGNGVGNDSGNGAGNRSGGGNTVRS